MSSGAPSINTPYNLNADRVIQVAGLGQVPGQQPAQIPTQAYVSGGTTTIDPTLGVVTYINAAGGNTTLAAASVAQGFWLLLIAGDGSIRTLTFGTNLTAHTASATIATLASTKTVSLLLWGDGSNWWEISRNTSGV